jgi:hypothetical protein
MDDQEQVSALNVINHEKLKRGHDAMTFDNELAIVCLFRKDWS